ncbi:MAG: c-type cytochrome [Meiothermus sp.]|nr:c-type cytochrome [Meiothermus sp.]
MRVPLDVWLREVYVKSKKIRVVVSLCLLGLGVGVVAQHDSTGATVSQVASKAVSDGVYTARQADRGKAIYAAQCAMCHGPAMAGGAAPALAGNAALARWKEKTVADVFTAIKVRMPVGKPGSLTFQQAADVTAYILQVNKFKAGNALLAQDAKALSDIAFDKAAQAAAVKAAQAAQAQAQAGQNQAAAQGPASGPRTTANGVFTVAQADRGKAAYTNPSNACSGCHGVDLGGSPGGPSLARGAFRNNWGGKTVADLFTKVKTMPPGRANTLEESAYLDIITYILQVNGYPAGAAELTANLDDLKQITIPK